MLGKAKLPVKAKKKKVSKGDRQVVKVKGLAAAEKVSVRVRHTLVATGTATAAASSRRSSRSRRLAAPGRPKVVVTGQFPDLRKGVTYFRVTDDPTAHSARTRRRGRPGRGDGARRRCGRRRPGRGRGLRGRGRRQRRRRLP